jgi:maleate isomerase
MTVFPYDLQAETSRPRQLGLIVLETDETIERDLRRMIPVGTDVLVSRVPFPTHVSPETLQSMEGHMTASASLLPGKTRFATVGYGCTSGAAQIGPQRVAERVREGCQTDHVTEPVSALVAACQALGVSSLAFLSPYVESVSGRLRDVLWSEGIGCSAVGTFDEPDDSRVARIEPLSIEKAALALASQGNADAVFLSCTNLQTLTVIERLEVQLGRPVLSSNLVLAWHMMRLAGIPPRDDVPGRVWLAQT